MKMEKNVILYIFLLTTMNLTGQNEYDCIKKDDFFLLKTDSANNKSFRIETSELKNFRQAERLFGNDYHSSKCHDLLFDEDFLYIVYNNGLELIFSETYHNLFTFEIISNNYTMLLSNGFQIKTGMKGEELAAIFPKSYAKRKEYLAPDPRRGKVSFIVFFCFNMDNKIQYADSWIIFILNEKNGILEQFLSYIPG